MMDEDERDILSRAEEGPLEAAREALCASLPRPGPDSLGRQHRSIVHDAIRRGDWDGGSLMQSMLAKVQP